MLSVSVLLIENIVFLSLNTNTLLLLLITQFVGLSTVKYKY